MNFKNYFPQFNEKSLTYIKDNKQSFFIAFIISIIFIWLGTYVFNTYVKPLINKNYVANKEFIDHNKKDDNEVIIYFFYTDWCPYCKKAKPEWNEFKKEVNESVFYSNSYNIVFEEIDCDKNTSLANKYKIDSYPTIKLVYQNKIYDYDAKPNSDNLMAFLEGSINN